MQSNMRVWLFVSLFATLAVGSMGIEGFITLPGEGITPPTVGPPTIENDMNTVLILHTIPNPESIGYTCFLVNGKYYCSVKETVVDNS